MTDDLARRFLRPTDPRQRRCEALRACYVEGCTTAEAAARFGYSPGSLRNLRSRFVNSGDPGFLFPPPERAKPPSPSAAADLSGEARRRALELRRGGAVDPRHPRADRRRGPSSQRRLHTDRYKSGRNP